MTFDEASKLIRKGDIIRLREGLQDGLSPNLENQYSWTLLMIAAMEGNTGVGSLLIESGADLDRRNKGEDSALSLAAQTGHPSFVGLLLTAVDTLDTHCSASGECVLDRTHRRGVYFQKQMRIG
jgi:ankyrin repeat protein